MCGILKYKMVGMPPNGKQERDAPMRKIFAFIGLLAIVLSVFALPAFAAGGALSVRVEGPTENLYYNNNMVIDIDYRTTVYEILYSLDASGKVDFAGIEVGYIAAVNGIAGAQTELGWDGYSVRVNGEYIGWDEIRTARVKDGDDILVYYSDEFGEGISFPVVKDDDIEAGKLRFITETPVVNKPNSYMVEPIVDATVRWYIGEDYVDFKTSSSGEILIDRGFLSSGAHRIEIIKNNENGTPAVLRLAPEYTINVHTAVGDSPLLYILIALMAVSAIGFVSLVLVGKKKRS